ncbi:conjugal transfer protein [Streptococcus dentiloxodontae]
MTKLKTFLAQLLSYFSRFKKTGKKRSSPKLIRSTRKTANLLVTTGLALLVLIGLLGAFRAITLSNRVTNLENKVKNSTSVTSVSTNTETDYRLTYYLNSFVSAYFTFSDNAEEQEKQTETLNSFYDEVPEVKSQGQKRTATSLVSAKLLVLTDEAATYQVTYKQKNGDEDEEITTGFNIPYGTKGKTYYISGLPWFSTLSDSQATGFDEDSALELTASDNLSKKKHQKVEKFLNVFFTNYTTDQDNLDLVGNHLTVLENTTFNTLDYVYLKENGDDITVYVQVTFEVAGNTRSENFTLTLTPKGDSYYVKTLKHTIPKDYAQTKGN